MTVWGSVRKFWKSGQKSGIQIKPRKPKVKRKWQRSAPLSGTALCRPCKSSNETLQFSLFCVVFASLRTPQLVTAPISPPFTLNGNSFCSVRSRLPLVLQEQHEISSYTFLQRSGRKQPWRGYVGMSWAARAQRARKVPPVEHVAVVADR